MLELGPEHELDIALETSRSESYRVLKSQLEGAGLFTAPGSLLGYGADLVRYTILGAVAAWLYLTSTSALGWFISAVCLGAFWHQLTCKSPGHHRLPKRHHSRFIPSRRARRWPYRYHRSYRHRPRHWYICGRLDRRTQLELVERQPQHTSPRYQSPGTRS